MERLYRKDKRTGRFLSVNTPQKNSVLSSRKRLSEKWRKYAWLDVIYNDYGWDDGLLVGSVWQGWDWVGSMRVNPKTGIASGRLGSGEPNSPCYAPDREVFVGKEPDVFRKLMDEIKNY